MRQFDAPLAALGILHSHPRVGSGVLLLDERVGGLRIGRVFGAPRTKEQILSSRIGPLNPEARTLSRKGPVFAGHVNAKREQKASNRSEPGEHAQGKHRASYGANGTTAVCR